MIYIGWLVWFVNVSVMLICLLNFLIAIVSQSYDIVAGESVQFRSTQRCEMNIEQAIFAEEMSKILGKP